MVEVKESESQTVKDSVTTIITRGVPKPERSTYRVTDKVLREESSEEYWEPAVDEETGEPVLDDNGDQMKQLVKVTYAGCEGIAKNGELFKPGDEIVLDDKTAASFLELGEIEVVE